MEIEISGLIVPLIFLSFVSSIALIVVIRFPPCILLANVAFSAITKNTSNVFLDLNSVYLFETAINSGTSLSSIRQLAYNSVILGSACLILRVSLGPFSSFRSLVFKAPQKLRQFSLLLAAGLVLLQLLNVVSSPGTPAFPGGVPRQAFWTHSIRIPILRDFLGQLMVFVPAVVSYCAAIAYVERLRREMLQSIAVGIIYFSFLIISGQKLNGILVGAFFLSGPFYIITKTYSIRFVGMRKGMLSIRYPALLVVLATPLVIFFSVLGFAERGISIDRGGALNGILYRAFAMQGAVYYTEDKIAHNLDGKSAGVSIVNDDMESLIRLVVPANLAESYIYSGVNLAGSLPGTAILVGGYWLAVPICLIYGIILGAVSSIVGWAIRSGRVLHLFTISYLQLWVISAYGRGSLAPILTIEFAGFVVLTAVLEMAVLVKRRRVDVVDRLR